MQRTLIAATLTLCLAATPAMAQVVGGSGGLVGSGDLQVPGVGLGADAGLTGSVGVDAGHLKDRTTATAHATTERAKRAAARAERKARKATPEVQAGASGAVSTSPNSIDAQGSAGASVRPD